MRLPVETTAVDDAAAAAETMEDWSAAGAVAVALSMMDTKILDGEGGECCNSNRDEWAGLPYLILFLRRNIQ